MFGASGTTGVELVRLIDGHPELTLKFATSRGAAGKNLRTVDPAALSVELTHPDDVALSDVDIAFLCLPHGEGPLLVERCLSADLLTIDLSGDYRLTDPELHLAVYGSARSSTVAEHAVYGLTECNREAVAQSRFVSNPGCYPTCAGLALYPLARHGLLPATIIIDAKSGISGAGRKATSVTHFTSVADDVRPYQLGRAHRHAPEIEQSLSDWGADGSRVVFCPHIVPLERGMLATIVVEIPDGQTLEDIRALYSATYDDEPFVDLLPVDEPARIRGVVRTNRASIGLAAVDGLPFVVITSAIDNLLKGAAGQAVQNLNAMLGIPETLGLGAPTATMGVPA